MLISSETIYRLLLVNDIRHVRHNKVKNLKESTCVWVHLLLDVLAAIHPIHLCIFLSNHSRRPSLIENLVFCWTSTLFPEISVSCCFDQSQNKKNAKKTGLTLISHATSINIKLRSEAKFLSSKFWMDWILESNQML